MRTTAIALASVYALGCAGEITQKEVDRTFDDTHAESLVLEDDELRAELSEARVRSTDVPFERVGLIWDAERTVELEISTSLDGHEWSDWSAVDVVDVEVEGGVADAGDASVGSGDAPSDRTSMIGHYEVDGPPATHYRIRSASDDVPTFLVVDLLDLPRSAALEDGESLTDDTITRHTQSLSLSGADVNSRAAWGASEPRCVTSTSPSRFTVHHTVTPTNDTLSPEARLRQIQSYHMNVLGWCDIGYNYLISRDGRIWEGRGATRLGTHVANNNTGNVGISLIGTYTSTSLNNSQLEQTAALIRSLGDQFGIAVDNGHVHGHRDFNQTACPGDAAYGSLGEIIDRAQDGPPVGDPGDPGASGSVQGIVYHENDTGRRLEGVEVTLGDRTTTTNANGYYAFDDVQADTYEITASLGGYEEQTITRAVSGEETWGSMGLAPASGSATIVGVVYEGSNTANRVPGATVELSSGHAVTADQNGYYELADIPAGTYTISASGNGSTGSVERDVGSGATVWGSISL